MMNNCGITCQRGLALLRHADFGIRHFCHVFMLALVVAGWCAPTSQAATRLKDICRVTGQEENALHGMGLVVGLAGTGDGGNFLPTMRSLATAMALMGSRLGKGQNVEIK